MKKIYWLLLLFLTFGFALYNNFRGSSVREMITYTIIHGSWLFLVGTLTITGIIFFKTRLRFLSIVLIIASISLFLFGVYIYVNMNSFCSTAITPPHLSTNKFTGECRYFGYSGCVYHDPWFYIPGCKAIWEGNPELCEEVDGDRARDLCYLKSISYFSDISVCNVFSINTSCISNVVRDTNNTTLCGHAGDAADDCYLYYGRILLNDSACLSINDVGDHDRCLRYVIQERGLPELCKMMKENDSVTTCLDRAYKIVADKTMNITYCHLILDNHTRRKCVLSLGSSVDDPSICEYISDDDRNKRDACYYRIAVKTNDESICGLIWSGSLEYDRCYVSIIYGKKDLSLCDQIDAETTKQLCRAVVSLDYNHCWETEYEQSHCAIEVVKLNGDVNACHDLPGDGSRDYKIHRDNCYWYASGFYNDTIFCHFMEIDFLIDDCENKRFSGSRSITFK